MLLFAVAKSSVANAFRSPTCWPSCRTPSNPGQSRGVRHFSVADATAGRCRHRSSQVASGCPHQSSGERAAGGRGRWRVDLSARRDGRSFWSPCATTAAASSGETAARLSSRFFTTRADGTGLGLSIARGGRPPTAAASSFPVGAGAEFTDPEPAVRPAWNILVVGDDDAHCATRSRSRWRPYYWPSRQRGRRRARRAERSGARRSTWWFPICAWIRWTACSCSPRSGAASLGPAGAADDRLRRCG